MLKAVPIGKARIFRKAKIRIKILAHSFLFINQIPPIISGIEKINMVINIEIARTLNTIETSISIFGIKESPKNKKKKNRAIRKFRAP